MPKKKIVEKIEFPSSFFLVSGDISLRRPGFAILKYENNSVELVETICVNNKTKNKPKGEMLNDIKEAIESILYKISSDNVFFCREKYISAHNSQNESTIFKAVGISDWIVWKFKEDKEWNDIYPVTVKKLVTGNGKATKEEVAEALKTYVGEHEYEFDDESDATAVGVAFLIQNNLIEVKNNVKEDVSL